MHDEDRLHKLLNCLGNEKGYVNVLDYLHKFVYTFIYDNYAIWWACKNGHANILEWFHQRLKLCGQSVDVRNHVTHNYYVPRHSQQYEVNNFKIMHINI